MISSTDIEARLRAQLAVTHVEVVDESDQHAGHAGARGGGRHFRATIVSDAFAGRGLLERQRLVFAVVADEMKTGAIHALAMSTHTPDEWARKRGAAG